MHTVYIGAGSNLGDRLENLRRAAKLLGESKDTELIKVSKIYETEPWGYADQGRFLNCVFEMSTPLAPESFLALLLSTEKKLKRKRTIPNGPRTIDLDILFYDDLVTASERIAIPHPRLHERMFVLRPFCDLAPDHVHPVFGLPCSRILEDRKKKHGEAEPPEFPQSFWQAG